LSKDEPLTMKKCEGQSQRRLRAPLGGGKKGGIIKDHKERGFKNTAGKQKEKMIL